MNWTKSSGIRFKDYKSRKIKVPGRNARVSPFMLLNSRDLQRAYNRSPEDVVEHFSVNPRSNLI
jgi:hypothetical protein